MQKGDTSHQRQYDVSIDFDEASREWRANKRHIGNGMFVYTCLYIFPGGRKGYKCGNKCMGGSTVCYIHRYKMSSVINSDSDSD